VSQERIDVRMLPRPWRSLPVRKSRGDASSAGREGNGPRAATVRGGSYISSGEAFVEAFSFFSRAAMVSVIGRSSAAEGSPDQRARSFTLRPSKRKT